MIKTVELEGAGSNPAGIAAETFQGSSGKPLSTCTAYIMENKTEPVLDDLPDPDLKIILLGDSAVGKSKLIERYLMDEYNPRQVRMKLSKDSSYYLTSIEFDSFAYRCRRTP